MQGGKANYALSRDRGIRASLNAAKPDTVIGQYWISDPGTKISYLGSIKWSGVKAERVRQNDVTRRLTYPDRCTTRAVPA